MSYKALYEIYYFINLSAHVMLSKAYPTYMFLKEHISKRTYSVQQHIELINILCSTTYVGNSTYMAYTTYMFNNSYLFLNNMYMLLNLIRHMYVMYP